MLRMPIFGSDYEDATKTKIKASNPYEEYDEDEDED